MILVIDETRAVVVRADEVCSVQVVLATVDVPGIEEVVNCVEDAGVALGIEVDSIVERTAQAEGDTEVVRQVDIPEERERLGIGVEHLVIADAHDLEPLVSVLGGVEVAGIVDADNVELALAADGRDHLVYEVVRLGQLVLASRRSLRGVEAIAVSGLPISIAEGLASPGERAGRATRLRIAVRRDSEVVDTETEVLGGLLHLTVLREEVEFSRHTRGRLVC